MIRNSYKGNHTSTEIKNKNTEYEIPQGNKYTRHHTRHTAKLLTTFAVIIRRAFPKHRSKKAVHKEATLGGAISDEYAFTIWYEKMEKKKIAKKKERHTVFDTGYMGILGPRAARMMIQQSKANPEISIHGEKKIERYDVIYLYLRIGV